MFEGIFQVNELGNLVPRYGLTQTGAIFVCIAVALACGAIAAAAYCIKNKNYTTNLLVSFAVLPVVVMTVVMCVNRWGGIGVGVAIGGAFALIRFRSWPGNARDISCIFMAMTAGVAAGIGQIFLALLITGIVGAIFVALKFIPFDQKREQLDRRIQITVAEDLDFAPEFEPIFTQFTTQKETIGVKTSKMGSLFVITYRIRLKKPDTEKALIDAIRVKNGNLPIVCKLPVRDNSGL